MNEAALPELALLAMGVIASWTDITMRRIPNWLSLLTLVSGLAFVFYRHGLASTEFHALHAIAALLVGMALFAAGIIGGGDAKFYAGVAAWFDLAQAWRLFVFVSFWGLLALIVWFSVRRIRGMPIRRQGGGLEGVPYGIAIALGGVTVATMGLST